MISRLICGLAAFVTCTAMAAAQDVAIDFSVFASGTAITEPIQGVSFTLLGGPGPDGPPITAGPQLLDSTTASGPSANILAATFSGLANNVSFYFNPGGYSAASPASDSYYTALDANGTLLETGKLAMVTGGVGGSFSVGASDIKTLEFHTGSPGGTESFMFALLTLNATVVSAVPELPEAVLLTAGLALFACLYGRRSFARSAFGRSYFK